LADTVIVDDTFPKPSMSYKRLRARDLPSCKGDDMQGDIEHSDDHNRITVSLRGVACLIAALVAVGVLAAGCGGTSSSTGGVAHLGSSTQAASSTAAESGGGSRSSASPESQAVAYSACVRAHGVPDFPDPKISTHGNEVSVAIAINPAISGNHHFKSAQQACRELLPGGGPGEGSQRQVTPQEQSQYLKAAACIRSHGVPSFPDPTFSGGGVHIEHQGLNESSPAFKAAVHDCESLIPGGVHHNSGSTRETAPTREAAP
jgi:hypothetical protein